MVAQKDILCSWDIFHVASYMLFLCIHLWASWQEAEMLSLVLCFNHIAEEYKYEVNRVVPEVI